MSSISDPRQLEGTLRGKIAAARRAMKPFRISIAAGWNPMLVSLQAARHVYQNPGH